MVTRREQPFDLEERTTEFAIRVVKLCRSRSKRLINNRITGQLVGSAGSIGANYREANDSLGKKDFLQRLRIARKEAKETAHWLELLKKQMLRMKQLEKKSSIVCKKRPN